MRFDVLWHVSLLKDWGATEEAGEAYTMPNVAARQTTRARRRAKRLPWSGDGGGPTSPPRPKGRAVLVPGRP